MIIDSSLIPIRDKAGWTCGGSREQIERNALTGSSRTRPAHQGNLQGAHLNYSSQSNRDFFFLPPDRLLAGILNGALRSRELRERRCP